MRLITRWVKSFICVCLNSHLNLGRKGTSSSKDKKLNCTVEARWKYKFTNIREMQKWDWEEKKSNMEKYQMWSFFTLDWFVLFLLLQLTVWYSGRSFGQKCWSWMKRSTRNTYGFHFLITLKIAVKFFDDFDGVQRCY